MCVCVCAGFLGIATSLKANETQVLRIATVACKGRQPQNKSILFEAGDENFRVPNERTVAYSQGPLESAFSKPILL